MEGIVIHPGLNSNHCTSNGDSQKEKWLKILDDHLSRRNAPNAKPHFLISPKIQRIHFMLRDNKGNYDKYFVPRVVSVGPLHHHNKKLKMTEDLKITLAALFIQEHHIEKEVLYDNVLNHIEQFKGCYHAEDLKVYNDEELAWMFLVDGCAVLHHIQYAANKRLKELKVKNDQAEFVMHDLFLLENQLPFELLRLLISSCPEQSHRLVLRESIYNFINMSIAAARGALSPLIIPKEEEEEEKTKPPVHLLELFRKCFIGESEQQKDEITKVRRGWYSFRNVNQLKAAGITMKSSKGASMGDIEFINGWFTGTLKLPSLVIDDSTAPKFLNLIALEMCPDFENDFEVTSYICFMDSLIDDRDDVKELREGHILRNDLGSDKEVAVLFNTISDGLVSNPRAYSVVKYNMQKHYETKWRTWIAIFLHDHFNTPWTALAFVGALIALILTFVQTWYAIFPL